MTKLEDVTKLHYDNTAHKLTVTYNNGADNKEFMAADGILFNMESGDNGWNLEIDSDVVKGDFTEIKTRKGDTELNFALFKPGVFFPRMEFIGIQDIRDGRASVKWQIYYEESKMSIKTIGDRIILRKKHYN